MFLFHYERLLCACVFRARYLTEGSRGAIKDRSGHGYPVVKLCGPVKQTVKVQCFIGHDRQIGTPHLFYQASKIAGKNSTTCFIKKTEGTSIITMELSPANNMEVTVDCIGILKVSELKSVVCCCCCGGGS